MNTIVKRIYGRHSIPSLVGWLIRRSLRLATARMRTLPDFVIIGGQRCGTTSLYNYLAEHPRVLPAFMKETHFFDMHYHRGINWYRAFFPLAVNKKDSQVPDHLGLLTGESTPSYLFYPHAPERMASLLPEVRLVALLRNPVDRAYSHYHHEVSMGFESLSFEDALAREEKELPAEAERVSQDETYLSFTYLNYSYLSRGIYADQLEQWTKWFSRKRLLVLRSEDLARDPTGAMKLVTEFLNLPPLQLPAYKPYHLAQYPPMDVATRRRLVAYFERHNQRLYSFLGMDLGWE